jgi:hypothetical protein
VGLEKPVKCFRIRESAIVLGPDRVLIRHSRLSGWSLASLDTITDQMNEPRDQGLEAYERGRTLLTAGDVSGAIAQLEASIIAYPHFKSLELLGEAWLQSGNALRAIVPLAAATTLNRQVRAPPYWPRRCSRREIN